MKNLYGFYGSLRSEGYNFKRLGIDKTPHQILGIEKIPGYYMADLGPYPMIFRSQDNNDAILLEIVELNDQRTCEWIDLMERGAGYEPHTITSAWGDVTFYVGALKRAETKADFQIVKSGDWIGYCKENNKMY